MIKNEYLEPRIHSGLFDGISDGDIEAFADAFVDFWDSVSIKFPTIIPATLDSLFYSAQGLAVKAVLLYIYEGLPEEEQSLETFSEIFRYISVFPRRTWKYGELCVFVMNNPESKTAHLWKEFCSVISEMVESCKDNHRIVSDMRYQSYLSEAPLTMERYMEQHVCHPVYVGITYLIVFLEHPEKGIRIMGMGR